MLEHLVGRILTNTSQGLDLENVHASKETYANLFFDADTFHHSRFLDTLVNLPNIDCQERAQRL